MLKNLLAVFFVLAFSTAVFGTVFMHSPVEAKIANGESVQAGKVAPGQTVVFVIEKKSEKAEKWNSLFVDSGLPGGWEQNEIVSDETIAVGITLPSDAKTASQRLSFSAFSSDSQGFGDRFFAELLVMGPKSVFDVGMDVERFETSVGEKIPLSITISNNSVAESVFSVSSSLPTGWLRGNDFTLVVPPLSAKTFSFFVEPSVYGRRKAEITLSSQQNSFSEKLSFELNVFPTLRSKFQAPLFGLPFFSLTLWPQYLLNALLSLIS